MVMQLNDAHMSEVKQVDRAGRRAPNLHLLPHGSHIIIVGACVRTDLSDTWLHRRSSASSTCPLSSRQSTSTALIQGSDTGMSNLDRNVTLRMRSGTPVHAYIRYSFVSSCAWISRPARNIPEVNYLGLDVGRSRQRSLGTSRVYSHRAYGLHMLRQVVVNVAIMEVTHYASFAA